MFRLRLKAQFGGQRLNQITRQQIQMFHTSLKNEGLSASTCNHYVKLMKHSLNLAIDWGMLDTNPAVRVPLFNEDNKQENYLSETELEQLMTVMRNDENRTICMIIMYLLSTGARLNEALQATWSQIDRERRVWRIPASNSKSKRIRSVPLNDSAIDVLNQLDTEGNFEHLFINRQTGEPYTTIHKVWGRLRRKAGLTHLRIHDLRHQYASFLVNSGRTLYEVQQILGHSDPSVTQQLCPPVNQIFAGCSQQCFGDHQGGHAGLRVSGALLVGAGTSPTVLPVGPKKAGKGGKVVFSPLRSPPFPFFAFFPPGWEKCRAVVEGVAGAVRAGGSAYSD